MKRFLLLSCALALAGAVQASSPGTALTAQQISDQATAESKSLQIIERQADGRVRMTAPMQAMEALIGPVGTELRSIDAGGEAAFSWRLGAVGRTDSLHALVDLGEVAIQGERVAVLRPQAIEEFTATADGIRQDFVIPRPPPTGEGELVLELEADGVKLENLPRDNQAVTLHMADGRELHYHALRVTDANGHELPARMYAHTGVHLHIAMDDAGAQYPIRIDPTFSDADWTVVAAPDFNGEIYAAVLGDGDLYVGGKFNKSPGEPANYVARWDGSAWFALGAGVGGVSFPVVYALSWDAANGHLYAGGNFTSAGDNPASHVARWDGDNWSDVGGGLSGTVHALAWDEGNEHLYAGGGFTSAGGSYARRIARWDGEQWSALGNGMSTNVYALAWDAANGCLYAGGHFTSADGTSANRIARWDGHNWSTLGSGMNFSVRALAWDATNGHLYAGGDFTTAGGDPANHIARWDGNTWSALGEGMNGNVRALAWDAANGHLYAAGFFTSAGGNSVRRIARWDGAGWSGLTEEMNHFVYAMAWDSGNNHLYAGGYTFADTAISGYIARWEGGAWSGIGGGMNDQVFALAWDTTNGHLYAGGSFTFAGGNPANRIARWDGASWSALGSGTNGTVLALAWDASNGYLYAGGSFLSAGGIRVDGIARWDGTTWSDLSTHSAFLHALAWDASNANLYAGGSFHTAGGTIAHRIARWDGNTWSALGSGMNFSVRALAWDATNGHLYAGGDFTTAGGGPANHIARWDGNAWSTLGEGMDSDVRALAWDAANGRLYAGGYFTSADDNSANHVACWDGVEWSALGSGTNGGVEALAWNAASNYLYVGGNFTSAGGSTANHIALWDGVTWSAASSGMNGSVNALVWDADNKQLYAGGSFTTAGGQLARIARLETRPHQVPPLAVTVTPDTVEYGEQSTLSVTGGSGTGAVTYAVTAGEEFCSISDDILTGIGAGTCTVTAAKAGDPDYRPSSDTVDVTVSRIAGTLVFGDLNFGYNGDPHEVTAHIDKEPESVCMSPIGPDAGDYTVSLTCEGINYIASGSEIANIAKVGQAPLIVTASPAVILAGQSSLLSVSGGSGDGEISFVLTDGAEFCEFDAGALTGLALGTCTVTATKAGDANYHPGSASVNVTIAPEGVFTDRFEPL